MSVLRYRHLFVCIVLIAVLLSCTVMAGAEFTTSDSIVLGEIKRNSNLIYDLLITDLSGTNGIRATLTNLYTLLNGTYGIRTIHDLIKSIDTDVASIVTKLTGVQTTLSSINSSCGYLFYLEDIDQTLDDNLPDINTSTQNISDFTDELWDTVTTDLWETNSVFEKYPGSWLAETGAIATRISDMNLNIESIWNDTAELRRVLAGENDSMIATQTDPAKQSLSANDVFKSPAFMSNTNSLATLAGNSFFQPEDRSIDPSFALIYPVLLFEIWFSQSTADSLSVGAGSAAFSSVSPVSYSNRRSISDTPYYDDAVSSFNDKLGGILNGQSVVTWP